MINRLFVNSITWFCFYSYALALIERVAAAVTNVIKFQNAWRITTTFQLTFKQDI